MNGAQRVPLTALGRGGVCGMRRDDREDAAGMIRFADARRQSGDRVDLGPDLRSAEGADGRCQVRSGALRTADWGSRSQRSWLASWTASVHEARAGLCGAEQCA